MLDTHVWLWVLESPSRIRPNLIEELQAENTQLVLSAVSSWEIAIKWTVGRLKLPEPPALYVPRLIQTTAVTPLAIEHSHAIQVSSLPRNHDDPFDRLLIAQAQVESIPIVTADRMFERYDVEVIRAQ